MSYYPDSSFLVSCYVPDVNTAKAQIYLSRLRVPLAFTALHALEVRNAFKLGVFRGLITSANATAALANLEADLRAGRLVRTIVNWPVVFRVAARLSDAHSSLLGNRSLDILHVASAKALRSIELISFDSRQRTLASAIGLSIAP